MYLEMAIVKYVLLKNNNYTLLPKGESAVIVKRIPDKCYYKSYKHR